MGANEAVTEILFEKRQLFPDKTLPEMQLKQVVGEFLHVAHGDSQATHVTGSPPALDKPKRALKSLLCWVAAWTATNPEEHIRQVVDEIHLSQPLEQSSQICPFSHFPS